MNNKTQLTQRALDTPGTDGAKFTERQIRQWRAYEKVRSQGRYNMFDVAARSATGLSINDFIFVMKNFTALKQSATKE